MITPAFFFVSKRTSGAQPRSASGGLAIAVGHCMVLFHAAIVPPVSAESCAAALVGCPQRSPRGSDMLQQVQSWLVIDFPMIELVGMLATNSFHIIPGDVHCLCWQRVAVAWPQLAISFLSRGSHSLGWGWAVISGRAVMSRKKLRARKKCQFSAGWLAYDRAVHRRYRFVLCAKSSPRAQR